MAHSRGGQVGAGWWVAGSPAGAVGGWGWALGPGSSPYACSHPWRLDSKVEAPGQDGVLVRQPWESRSIPSIALRWWGLHPAGPHCRGGALPPGQECGEGACRVGSPMAGVSAKWEGESLRRRLVLCLDGFLRMRQAPFMVAPFPSKHCPLQSLDSVPTSSTSREAQCPSPFATPARDLQPALSDCSLYPKEYKYFPLPKRRTWPRDRKEACWPTFST